MQTIKEKSIWKYLNSSEVEMEVKTREFRSCSDYMAYYANSTLKVKQLMTLKVKQFWFSSKTEEQEKLSVSPKVKTELSIL